MTLNFFEELHPKPNLIMFCAPSQIIQKMWTSVTGILKQIVFSLQCPLCSSCPHLGDGDREGDIGKWYGTCRKFAPYTLLWKT